MMSFSRVDNSDKDCTDNQKESNCHTHSLSYDSSIYPQQIEISHNLILP